MGRHKLHFKHRGALQDVQQYRQSIGKQAEQAAIREQKLLQKKTVPLITHKQSFEQEWLLSLDCCQLLLQQALGQEQRRCQKSLKLQKVASKSAVCHEKVDPTLLVLMASLVLTAAIIPGVHANAAREEQGALKLESFADSSGLRGTSVVAAANVLEQPFLPVCSASAHTNTNGESLSLEKSVTPKKKTSDNKSKFQILDKQITAINQAVWNEVFLKQNCLYIIVQNALKNSILRDGFSLKFVESIVLDIYKLVNDQMFSKHRLIIGRLLELYDEGFTKEFSVNYFDHVLLLSVETSKSPSDRIPEYDVLEKEKPDVMIDVKKLHEIIFDAVNKAIGKELFYSLKHQKGKDIAEHDSPAAFDNSSSEIMVISKRGDEAVRTIRIWPWIMLVTGIGGAAFFSCKCVGEVHRLMKYRAGNSQPKIQTKGSGLPQQMTSKKGGYRLSTAASAAKRLDFTEEKYERRVKSAKEIMEQNLTLLSELSERQEQLGTDETKFKSELVISYPLAKPQTCEDFVKKCIESIRLKNESKENEAALKGLKSPMISIDSTIYISSEQLNKIEIFNQLCAALLQKREVLQISLQEAEREAAELAANLSKDQQESLLEWDNKVKPNLEKLEIELKAVKHQDFLDVLKIAAQDILPYEPPRVTETNKQEYLGVIIAIRKVLFEMQQNRQEICDLFAEKRKQSEKIGDSYSLSQVWIVLQVRSKYYAYMERQEENKKKLDMLEKSRVRVLQKIVDEQKKLVPEHHQLIYNCCLDMVEKTRRRLEIYRQGLELSAKQVMQASINGMQMRALAFIEEKINMEDCILPEFIKGLPFAVVMESIEEVSSKIKFMEQLPDNLSQFNAEEFLHRSAAPAALEPALEEAAAAVSSCHGYSDRPVFNAELMAHSSIFWMKSKGRLAVFQQITEGCVYS